MQSLVRYNIIIALAAAGLSYSTSVIAGLPLLASIYIALWIFLATTISYTLLRQGREVLFTSGFQVQKTILLLSVLGIGYLSYLLSHILVNSTEIIWILLVAAVFTIIYGLESWQLSSPFKIRTSGWLKLISIALVWTLSTSVIPLRLANITVASNDFILLNLQRFLLVFILCIPFDIKDAVREKALGLRSVPALLGNEFSIKLAKALAVLYWLLSSSIGWPYLIAASIVALLFVYWLNRYEKYNKLSQWVLRFDGLMIIESLLLLLVFHFV